MNLKDTYNRIAEDWHKDHEKDTWWINGTNAFVSFLNQGDLVLDVGCGGGTKARYLVDRGLRVVGIDFAEKFIEMARELVPEMKFIVLDMRDVDTLEETFEGIFVQASLLHIPKNEVAAVMHGFVSKLAPEGYLYVSVKEGRPGQPEEEVREESDYGYPYKRFFSYFTFDELKRHFEECGLKIVYENAEQADNTSTNWIQLIGQKGGIS